MRGPTGMLWSGFSVVKSRPLDHLFKPIARFQPSLPSAVPIATGPPCACGAAEPDCGRIRPDWRPSVSRSPKAPSESSLLPWAGCALAPGSKMSCTVHPPSNVARATLLVRCTPSTCPCSRAFAAVDAYPRLGVEADADTYNALMEVGPLLHKLLRKRATCQLHCSVRGSRQQPGPTASRSFERNHICATTATSLHMFDSHSAYCHLTCALAGLPGQRPCEHSHGCAQHDAWGGAGGQ